MVGPDEARELQPGACIGRAEHDDLGAAVGDADDRVQELALDEHPRALDLQTQPDLEARHDIMRALAALPNGQRAVAVLRYFEDLTETQTADVLGCSVGTVKSQAARALVTLRRSPLLVVPDRERR